MIELYNALKFTTMLFFIQKITFNLGVAFLKSVSIYRFTNPKEAPHATYWPSGFRDV